MKTTKKDARKEKILFAFVELYLEMGTPIGSNTLKDRFFPNVSSATIRNYFSDLEKEDLLDKQHISGGRTPTLKALKCYADQYKDAKELPITELAQIDSLENQAGEKVYEFLEKSVFLLSELTNSAVFISSPRFDQDYVTDIKLVFLDSQKILGVLLSHFGLVYSYVIPFEKKLSTFSIKRIEEHFKKRLSQSPSEQLDPQETKMADFLYNELMVRFITSYANFTQEDIHIAGLAKLLNYKEFKDPVQIASALAAFENKELLHSLAKIGMAQEDVSLFLGDQATQHNLPSNVAFFTIPYKMNEMVAGSIGIITSNQCNYKSIFAYLSKFAQLVTKTLTKNTYKFKISYRKPTETKTLTKSTKNLLDKPSFYLEHKEDL